MRFTTRFGSAHRCIDQSIMAPKGTRRRQQKFSPMEKKPRAAPDYNKPLPWCEGPKLKPFSSQNNAVQFVSLLSDPESEGHSHVFEVRIAEKPYALKVFKFYDDEMDRAGLQLSGHLGSISLEILHAHSDPFYNECRAYGKLIEKNLNGKVAVQCHGHITLPAKMEDELERRFGVGDWDRPEAEYNKPASKRQVLRAVVKELVQKDVPFTEKTLARMLRDLYCIRRQGIYPSDIFARNYKGGLLLDLSIAKTEPHFLLEIEDDWRVKTYKNRDLWQFDDMVEESEVKAWVRALPNEEYIAKLRPRPKEKS